MRSFVTGIDGFIGSWLAETLVLAGDDVSGLSRRHQGALNGVTRYRGEITDGSCVAAIIDAVKPDRVFHLAALNNVMQSLARPEETFSVNVNGTVHLLDAVRHSAPLARFVSVGSSAEYGRTARQTSSITEDLPLLPNSPYGISKVAAGLLCPVYFKAYGLLAVHVRPFAIIGPRKEHDVLSDFCKAVVSIERGQADHLTHGNLDAERDFVDVRDAAAALLLLSTAGVPGEAYNLCNQSRARLADLLEVLQAESRRPFSTKVDSSRMRPVDDPRILGSNAKLVALGYEPRHSLADSVVATLEYWRSVPP